MGRAVGDEEIARELLAMAAARAPAKTFCPSEVARRLSPDWRDLMPDIRRVAAGLQAAGKLVATQSGVRVEVATACGPIRLARPSGQDSAAR